MLIHIVVRTRDSHSSGSLSDNVEMPDDVLLPPDDV